MVNGSCVIMFLILILLSGRNYTIQTSTNSLAICDQVCENQPCQRTKRPHFSTLLNHNSRFVYGNKMKVTSQMHKFTENDDEIMLSRTGDIVEYQTIGVIYIDMVDFRRPGHIHFNF